MKIVIYFESGKHAEVVAQFANEELYMACLAVLEETAGDMGMVVTESFREDEEVTDAFDENEFN